MLEFFLKKIFYKFSIFNIQAIIYQQNKKLLTGEKFPKTTFQQKEKEKKQEF